MARPDITCGKCRSCGELDELDNLVEYEGEWFHLDCATDLTRCENCGCVYPAEDGPCAICEQIDKAYDALEIERKERNDKGERT